jgi:hypothetical protein
VTRPFHWGFVAVAGVFSLLSITERADLTVALPAAALAVAAAGLALLDAVRRAPPPTRTRATAERETPRGIRIWFRAGHAGREEILHVLDRIDRRGAHPDLPIRRPDEIQRLLRLPADEFRRHLASRLDELESAP